MWNTIEELGRIRRQELLDEARNERVARMVQRGRTDDPGADLRVTGGPAPRPTTPARAVSDPPGC